MGQMKRKVLLIGDFVGSYRSQNLVKSLLDQKHIVSLVSRQYYASVPHSSTLLSRLFCRARNLIAQILFFVETFTKIGFADILYLMPMNYRYILLAYLAKAIFRKPLISELYVSAYDTGRDRKWFSNENSLKANYYRLLDRILIEKSDIVIHVSRTELDYIAALVGAKVRIERSHILQLAVDPKGIAAPVPSELFRICWWGTFIPLHGLEKIIAAARILVNAGIAVRFDLFGLPGFDGHTYESMIIDLSLESHVILHMDKSFANGHLEPFLLTNCDLALGNFGESEKAHKVIVNKIVDAFAMGLPVLTMDSKALSEFINTNDELFVCQNTPYAIAETIIYIMQQPQERARRGAAGYQRYLQTFTIRSYSLGVQSAIEASLVKSMKVKGGGMTNALR